MHVDLLDILRCPFCGTAVSIVESDALVREGDHIETGVLGCECCAFPVVTGIPVMMADDRTRDALHALEAGLGDEAVFGLLGLSDDTARQDRFRDVMTGNAATYEGALEQLCHDAEGAYFFYRFTDPTFLTAAALLGAIGQEHWPVKGRTLDLCGGSGHLTRVLSGLKPSEGTSTPGSVLADVYFWKLWLARRFTSPDSDPVCCDANHPLPFAPGTFSTVVLADAFPYIWHKRLLAEEMARLVGADGVVVMPHVHSALGDNFSAGDTLTPGAHLALFASSEPRLFSDERLFNDVIEHDVVDLTNALSPEQLGPEPVFTMVASARADLFRRYELPVGGEVSGELSVNPLYRVERRGAESILTLTLPTPEYESEFSECRRYLPDSITVKADLTRPILPETLGEEYQELRDRRVLIDTPIGYC